MRQILSVAGCCFAILSLCPARLPAAPPSAAQALQLRPVQPDAEYAQPAGEEVGKCRVESIRVKNLSGWTVYGPAGQLLRRFVDTNGDNRIDQWCYYENGIEVYRDVDADFNGKAEQYRWLGTNGSRWGLDDDEDGQIDRWKVISPEEVTAEVVAALRTGDETRFRRVLLGAEELTSLGLGSDQAGDLEQRLLKAQTGFARYAQTQKLVQDKSQWVQFGATRPGVVPAGTAGSQKDLVLYDHAAAIIETEGRHGQVVIGTLVKVGEGWRVIDLPRDDGAAGLFFTTIAGQAARQAGEEEIGIDREMQQLLQQLEAVDQQLQKATTPADLGQLNARRAEILGRLVEQAQLPDEQQQWVKQFADTISAAIQTGDYPAGTARLKEMVARLTREQADRDLIAYVEFRYLTADYGQQIQKPNADFAKVQEKWLADLERFIREHPRVDDAAEAMLQLAIAQEFAGEQKEAGRWYARIVSDFPRSQIAVKAKGAKRRLESIGQSLPLQGATLGGNGRISLTSYRGQVVLLHYWATWCEPCKQDMQKIRALQAKFAGSRFQPIGINVDHDAQAAADYARAQRLGWPQLHEPGGLDSRLANELGVLTLPTMLLIDAQGRVVRRNIHIAELEEELKKQLN